MNPRANHHIALPKAALALHLSACLLISLLCVAVGFDYHKASEGPCVPCQHLI